MSTIQNIPIKLKKMTVMHFIFGSGLCVFFIYLFPFYGLISGFQGMHSVPHQLRILYSNLKGKKAHKRLKGEENALFWGKFRT